MTAKSGNESVGLTGPVVSQGGTAGHLPAGYSVREFQIEAVLGEGGFGVVYLGHRYTRWTARSRSRSTCRPSLATRNSDLLGPRALVGATHREAFDAGLRSFINEAQAARAVRPPALVKVLPVLGGNGTAYMVMPLYPARRCKRWIKQRTEPVDEAWLEQFLRRRDGCARRAAQGKLPAPRRRARQHPDAERRARRCCSTSARPGA